MKYIAGELVMVLKTNFMQ